MNEIEKIYQENPLDWRRHPHKLKSWTDTVTGYLNSAEKLSRCILENRKLMGRDYTWAVSINIEIEMLPEEIGEFWTKICRKLRDWIVALWVREASLSNHCNYHLIVKNEITKDELEEAIENSMPKREIVPWHKCIEPIINQIIYPRYITKAAVKGLVNGKLVRDKYRDKRLLFKPNLGFEKYGFIGPFWEISKTTMWENVQNSEKTIADGLKKPNIKPYAKHIHELVGKERTLKQIQRKYGIAAHDPEFQKIVKAFSEK